MSKRAASERDARLYGCVNELASGYGNFCSECKSRKVNESCFNCLKMFREKVKTKCEEAKAIRNSTTPHFWLGRERAASTPSNSPTSPSAMCTGARSKSVSGPSGRQVRVNNSAPQSRRRRRCISEGTDDDRSPDRDLSDLRMASLHSPDS